MTENPAPSRLRRAEAILLQRTSRIVLVMERPWNDDNVMAVLRTAESFGVQHVWMIRHPGKRAREKSHRSVTKGSHLWLTRRTFHSVDEFLDAAREDGLQIWATDLAPGADALDDPSVLRPFPERVAVVVGQELQGVAPKILAAADRRIFVPMRGFTESFNLSVAAALVLQRCFDAAPSIVGAMGDDERARLRREWFERLAGGKEGKLRAFRRFIEAPPKPLDDLRPAEGSRMPRLRKSDLEQLKLED